MTTKAEREWMDDITQIGCIACYVTGIRGAPGAVHHLLSGGRRRGHLDTICLCDPGHHQKSPTPAKISRHPFKARFERTYGTEEQLLEKSKDLVAILRAMSFTSGRQPEGRMAPTPEKHHEQSDSKRPDRPLC